MPSIQTCQRLVILLEQELGHALGFVEVGILGIQFDRPIEIGDRLFVVRLGQMKQPPRPHDLLAARSQLDGPVVIVQPRFGVDPQIRPQQEHLCLPRRLVRAQSHGFVECGNRPFPIAARQ